MIVYAVLMFLTALVVFVPAVMIYRGRTDLINSIHQEMIREEDREAWGKANARALFLLALTILICGGIVSLIMLFAEQRRYGGKDRN